MIVTYSFPTRRSSDLVNVEVFNIAAPILAKVLTGGVCRLVIVYEQFFSNKAVLLMNRTSDSGPVSFFISRLLKNFIFTGSVGEISSCRKPESACETLRVVERGINAFSGSFSYVGQNAGR